MLRFWLHIKLVWSGMIWAALAFAVALVFITINLVPLGLVNEVQSIHLIGLYEIAFSLIPIFIFSQLFGEEFEEGTFKWLFALPIHRIRFGLERWLIGMILLLVMYYGSLLMIHYTVIEVPWEIFTTQVLIPSFWFGQLALLATLLFRNDKVGLAIPLVHWTIESLSRGSLTGQWSLFQTTMPIGDHLASNRLLYFILAIAVFVSSLLIINRGVKEAS